MAGGADNQSLAPPLGHDLHPFGLRLSGLVEISELADLVHAHLVRVSAELTPSRKEPMDQLLAPGVGPGWFAISQDRVLLPYERNTTERGDQWLLAIAARDADLYACARPVRRFDCGPMLASHIRHRRVVLASQRLEQRGQHHPVKPVQSPDITGQVSVQGVGG